MRSLLKRVFVSAAVVAVLGVAACDEVPTVPEACELYSLGPTLSFVVPSASALQPALVDAQQRLLPSLSVPQSALAAEISTFSIELAGADEQTLCRAYNAVAERFDLIAPTLPVADGPDVEGIRLALRLSHAYLASN